MPPSSIFAADTRDTGDIESQGPSRGLEPRTGALRDTRRGEVRGNMRKRSNTRPKSARTAGSLCLVSVVLSVACGGRTGLPSGAASGDAGLGVDGGACVPEVIAHDPAGAGPIAVEDGVVVWGTVDGRVERRDSKGTATLATAPAAIASVAMSGGRVYFTTTGTLSSVAAGGGPTLTIASSLGLPFALVVDGTTYYLLDRGQGIAAGRLLRIEDGGAVKVLLTGLDVPTGLAIDGDSVFVAAHLALIDGGTLGPLLRVPKAGGTPKVLATGLHETSSIATYEGRVFFIEQVNAQSSFPGAVRSIDESGGAITTLASIDGALGIDLAVDASGIYWTALATTEGTLHRTPLAGGASTVLATGPKVQFTYVRTTASAIYWSIGWLTANTPVDPVSVRKLCK